MPWTRKQVKYLLSDVSPLSGSQQQKMKGELHANPAMGHALKGRVRTVTPHNGMVSVQRTMGRMKKNG